VLDTVVRLLAGVNSISPQPLWEIETGYTGRPEFEKEREVRNDPRIRREKADSRENPSGEESELQREGL